MDTQGWNAEREGQLKELFCKGMSFSLIARDIGVTRNAAIGKARRMQLSCRNKPLVTKERERSPDAPPKRGARREIRHPAIIARPVIIPDNRDYRCSIYDLTDSSCRYPIWDVGTPHEQRLYCGH